MPHKSIGEQPMTNAERQARCVLLGPLGHRQSNYGGHLITVVAPSAGATLSPS